MEIIESLEEIGLSRQEAQVYLNTIKLGDAKASEIAQKTNLQRGAIYYILKLLKEKGFVSEVTRSGIKYYSAASPNRIFQLIEDERRKKLTLLKEISKELKKLSATSLEKPRIEIYEGEEGFKTIFEKLLEKKNQEWRCYLSSEILEYNPIFHIQFRKRRKNNNISIRTITEKNQKMEEIKKLDRENTAIMGNILNLLRK